jgi:NTP pyrophosphatase (non-canonical NTP hydrolase)
MDLEVPLGGGPPVVAARARRALASYAPQNLHVEHRSYLATTSRWRVYWDLVLGIDVLTLNGYQALTDRTAGRSSDSRIDLAVWTLGLAGEAGEVAEHVKKYLGHGHDLDVGKVSKEIGDVLWYCATLARQLGLSLGDIGRANIAKLQARYGDRFSAEKSRNRDEEA